MNLSRTGAQHLPGRGGKEGSQLWEEQTAERNRQLDLLGAFLSAIMSIQRNSGKKGWSKEAHCHTEEHLKCFQWQTGRLDRQNKFIFKYSGHFQSSVGVGGGGGWHLNLIVKAPFSSTMCYKEQTPESLNRPVTTRLIATNSSIHPDPQRAECIWFTRYIL